jgi:hypothetical protein
MFETSGMSSPHTQTASGDGGGGILDQGFAELQPHGIRPNDLRQFCLFQIGDPDHIPARMEKSMQSFAVIRR